MKDLSQSEDIKSSQILIVIIVSGLLFSYLLVDLPLYALLIPTLLISFIAINSKPITVFLIAFPMLHIFYRDTFLPRTQLHYSIFELFLFLCAIFLIFQIIARRRIEEYRIYIPIFICGIVLLLYVLIGHGEKPANHLVLFLEGFWPLLLVTQFLMNTKQLKAIVVVWLLTFVAVSLFWLPALLTSTGRDWFLMHGAQKYYETFQYEGAFSYLVKYTIISSASLTAMAVSIPAFLGIALTKSKIRYLAFIAIPLIATTIALSTFLAPFIVLLTGTTLFFCIYFWKRRELKRGIVIVLTLVLLLLFLPLLGSPILSKTVARTQNFQEDASIAVRIEMMGLELKGLVVGTNPIIGYGSYEGFAKIEGMNPIMRHTSFPSLAFENGLLFFIPFICIIAAVLKRIKENLSRETTASADPFVIGLTSAFLIAIFAAFLNPIFLIPLTDSVVWLVAGIILVTNRKRELTFS